MLFNILRKGGRGRVNCESLASYSSQTASVTTVAILATSGMERHDLLIATAKLQLFQGQESISGIAAAAIKNVVRRCLSMKRWYGKCQPSHTASAALENTVRER